MAASSYEQPIRVGSVDLKHRTVMSAMTRTRGHYKTGVPSDLMVEYYSQRASDGGLLISEGVSPCAMGVCYLRGPGIWTEDQVWGSVRSGLGCTRGGGGSVEHCGNIL